jgi:hypothetical protein
VVPSLTNAQLTAVITITDQLDGRTISEASYRLASIIETRFRVPMSVNSNFRTGVSLAHGDVPSSPNATITSIARDGSGKALSTKQITLPPLTSGFLDLSDLFNGVANVAAVDVSTTGRMLSAIGTRFSSDSRVSFVDVVSLPLVDDAPARPTGTVGSTTAPTTCNQVMGMLVFADNGTFPGQGKDRQVRFTIARERVRLIR